MFIGHYTTAFAARAIKPAIPLWQLFVAVQLVDFAWAGLVLVGIEKVRVTKGFMEASMLDLHHMPYTHSLVAALVWAVAAAIVYALLRRGANKWMAGLVIGLAVFSHWLADLIVHGPDLALYFGGPKVGFGLWNSMLWSNVVELGALLIGATIYLAYTRPKGIWGRISPALLIAFMVAVQLYSHIPTETPPAVPQFAITALITYSLLAVLAWAVDRTREPA
ncbi:MAG: hypothetical protein L3J02_06035 [Henriciella sp.]|nr:hypothetical protein [Henriciella sp.]